MKRRPLILKRLCLIILLVYVFTYHLKKKLIKSFILGPVSGLQHGESSPGEFPWTCLILNQNNDFVGTCAIIPENSNNALNSGTSKVLTAAHNLKTTRGLKVRVGEYDASAFKSPEQQQHEEYSVSRVIKHPQFDPRRLSNDIAILRLSRRVNLNHRYVNAACLPSCDDQFSFTFRLA